MFFVPIEQALDIFLEARKRLSGLAKRVALVMSCKEGKMEVLYKTAKYIYFRLHRAPKGVQENTLLRAPLNPQAKWIEDYDLTYLE